MSSRRIHPRDRAVGWSSQNHAQSEPDEALHNGSGGEFCLSRIHGQHGPHRPIAEAVDLAIASGFAGLRTAPGLRRRPRLLRRP